MGAALALPLHCGKASISHSSPVRGGGPSAGWWRGWHRFRNRPSTTGPPPRTGEELARRRLVTHRADVVPFGIEEPDQGAHRGDDRLGHRDPAAIGFHR